MRYVKRTSLFEAQPLLADRAGLPVAGTAPSVMLETIAANRGSSNISNAVRALARKPFFPKHIRPASGRSRDRACRGQEPEAPRDRFQPSETNRPHIRSRGERGRGVAAGRAALGRRPFYRPARPSGGDASATSRQRGPTRLSGAPRPPDSRRRSRVAIWRPVPRVLSCPGSLRPVRHLQLGSSLVCELCRTWVTVVEPPADGKVPWPRSLDLRVERHDAVWRAPGE
jgi:hypothetical protein